MLQAYLDESGIQDGAPVCAIAGYFGGVNQWRDFEKQWKPILAREHIKEFHAKEFWGRKDGKRVPPYSDWSEQRADKFLSALLDVITRVKIYPVSAVVVIDEWNRLSHDERRYLTGARYSLRRREFITSGAPSKSYFLPFQACVLNAAIYCNPKLRMHVTLDLNKQFAGYARDLWTILKSEVRLTVRERLGNISFATSEEAVQLQAADLLAYEVYQFAQERVYKPTPKIGPVLMRAMYRCRSHTDYPFFDREGLELVLKNCPPKVRGSFLSPTAGGAGVPS